MVAVAALLYSAWVGWALTHPRHVGVTSNPSTAHDLIYRPLPATNYLIEPSARPLTTSDGVALRGWILPAPQSQDQEWVGTTPSLWSLKTVIIATDHGQNRLQQGFPTYDAAARLVAAGYNVILFDARGTGGSGGSAITYGVLEVRDLLAVVQYALSLGPPGGQIAIWGFGTGAAAAIETAAQSPHVNAVIADGSYATLDGYLGRNIPLWTGLPAFPFTGMVRFAMQAETGVSYGAFNPLDAVASLGGTHARPLLLVSGADDTVTPPADAQALYAAARDYRSFLLTVPGAGHLQSYSKDPREYMSRVLTVLSEMGGPSSSSAA